MMLHETSALSVNVGLMSGIPELGFNVRVSKMWYGYDNMQASRRLTRLLQQYVVPAWRESNDCSDHFVDVDFKSCDQHSAELERQQFIVALDALGFDVRMLSQAKSKVRSPYR